jgi:hypothetical protein
VTNITNDKIDSSQVIYPIDTIIGGFQKKIFSTELMSVLRKII